MNAIKNLIYIYIYIYYTHIYNIYFKSNSVSNKLAANTQNTQIQHTVYAEQTYLSVPLVCIFICSSTISGLPWQLRSWRTCLQCRRPQFDSWAEKIPWRRERLPTPGFLGFPSGSDSNESTCNEGDCGLIPGLGISPGGGHGNPLQDSCLENPMDRGAWWATVHGVTESDTTEWRSTVLHLQMTYCFITLYTNSDFHSYKHTRHS